MVVVRAIRNPDGCTATTPTSAMATTASAMRIFIGGMLSQSSIA